MIINTKRLAYLKNRRITFIQKANDPLHLKLQLLNNNLVDKKVNNPNASGKAFENAVVYDTIYSLNKLSTEKMFRRILESPLTNNSKAFEKLTMKQAGRVNRIISEVETKRVFDNLKYIEKTLSENKINISQYNQMAKSFPKVNRLNILEKAAEQGLSTRGREYTYKEIENLSKNLDRYKTHASDYEEALAANKEAEENGYPPIYPTKTWIWSQLDNTRHSEMDGVTVDIEEPFPVVNEQNGDSDDLLFPGDVENDSNNCSNICNCDCSVAFNTE